MDKTYLILDCNYLCYRAKYTTGGLSYHEQPTGVIYGFLKSLVGFQEFFGSSDFIFCWDSNTSKREGIYPEYKAQRHREYSAAEIEFDVVFRKQIKKLRTTYLPAIGFRNIFIQPGYESDDIIASVASDIVHRKLCYKILGKLGDVNPEAVIITRDKDLYQCIAPNVSICDPQTNKILTLQGFKKRYGIKPHEWSTVKALAGCTTDNVKGIPGIGETTAIKYLKGELTKGKKYDAILSEAGAKVFFRNLDLVGLPMKGTKRFQLQADELSEDGWRQVTEELGMSSIRDRMPFVVRRKRKTK
jgi:DNA polymerase-1